MGSSEMSVDEKIQLLHKLSNQSDSFLKTILQKWPCEDIRQILRVESERKYTGLTNKIINILSNIVSEKNIGDLEVQETRSSTKQTNYLDPLDNVTPPSARSKAEKNFEGLEVQETKSLSTTRNSKNQRKSLDPLDNVSSSAKTEGHGEGTIICKNWACKDKLKGEVTFCKRCSCCICLKYDEDKDTSLWLTCNSDPPFDGESCGFSFHISCAFNSEKSGLKEDTSRDADGFVFCVSCGKKHCLLECLKKLLENAIKKRRVAGLCCHLVLAQKLLKGTKKYKEPFEKVEKAVKLLETEFGCPLTGLPTEMHRAIVNRLCSAKDVKDLCSSALKLLDGKISKVSTETLPEVEEYQVADSLCLLSICSPSPPSLETEYKRKGKMVSLESDSDVSKIEEEICSEEKQLVLAENVKENLPVTPSCSDRINDREDRTNPGNCSFGLEQCVKILRQLESSGYVDNIFRQRFLSWYSLRSTSHEKHVVKTFIDTFKDDTSALADQLVDTFSDCISRKRSFWD